jgi:Hint domain
MKRVGHVGTRRQLFKVMTAAAASVPFLALAKKSAAKDIDRDWHHDHGRDHDHGWGHHEHGQTHCLLRGTRVSTPSGYRAVQELQIGDEVHTLAGRKAIKWIGYNKFTKEKDKAWIDSVMPIRVARFAIDDRSPQSDLYLSPLHCVFFNEALIPVKYLLNGTSIAPSAPADMSAIEYYHIDLGTHEVLYAEGALVESFFDGESDREGFSNFVEYERLYGAERLPKMTPFAPILGYRNRREKIEGVARSLISNVVDVRDPVQIARDQIAGRAQAMLV